MGIHGRLRMQFQITVERNPRIDRNRCNAAIALASFLTSASYVMHQRFSRRSRKELAGEGMSEQRTIPSATARMAAPIESDRQAFCKLVADHFAQAESQRTALSVLVAGLDGFRLVNDSLGWEEGDRVLDEVRAILDSRAGPPYRLGGDTFAISLPEVSAQAAMALTEGLREAVINAVRTPIGSVLVSLGVANHPESAISAPELVYGAEAAMYWAKASGGNKVGYWGELICTEGNASKRKGGVWEPVSALVATLERKTGTPSGQTARAAWYAKRVAKELGLSPADLEVIEAAALLHDIGKLATPSEILLKPGALTEEEKAIAREHPLVGRDILKRISGLAVAANIVAHHHEHYDGSGYQEGLQGEEIPIGSRIILVSDAFDAMTTHRAYRNVVSLQMATRELERCGGQQFDPRVVKAFVQIVSRQGLGALHWSQGSGR